MKMERLGTPMETRAPPACVRRDSSCASPFHAMLHASQETKSFSLVSAALSVQVIHISYH